VRINHAEWGAPTLAVGFTRKFSEASTLSRIATPFWAFLLAILSVFWGAVPASAVVISNGDDYVSSAAVGDPTASSSLVANESEYVGTPTFDATLESWVYANSSTNPYSTADGGSIDDALTFVYQISVSGTSGDVGQLDVANFGNNQTNVGYFSQSGSEALPLFLDRDLTGTTSTISFLFFPDGGQFNVVEAGYTSGLLVINTDATTYASSYAELQDGSNGVSQSYAVYGLTLSPTPEPASVVLMVLGLSGLFAVARARRRGQHV